MPFIQDIIYQFEVGKGARWLRWGLLGVLLVALIVGYDLRVYRNLAAPEAMDAAQVARNLSEGKGFTTQLIRPVSIALLRDNEKTTAADPGLLKGNHPDLANPPVYPLLLAGLMKVLPFEYSASKTAPFWSNAGHFWRYQPDFLIALFNQTLFLVVVVLTFLLARHLFDAMIGWVTALLLLGTELMWRFSVSGLSTMLLLVIFMGVVWCLVLLEESVREARWGGKAVWLLAQALGLCLGLGALTRYAFGWVIIPVLVFLLLFGGARKIALVFVTLGVFLAVVSPWVARNISVSGAPFGVATYAVVEGTTEFSEYKLQRALHPKFESVSVGLFVRKLMVNARRILENELPKIGGSWVTAYFLAGLLVAFRSVAISRLRYFLLISMAVLIAVQALGKTQLSEETPEINSENLLVLLYPLVLMFGVCLFFLLLDQVRLPDARFRALVMTAFGLAACAPLIFAFMPPRLAPVVYPPYYPPAIQQVSGWMKEDELMMSDVPWAVAWYGHRQCVWLTLNAQADFFAISDELKPVRGLYLTPQTMDARFLSQWIRAGEFSWGSFILESLLKKEIPPTFPLRKSPGGFLPEQMFLTDWERWKK